MKSVRRDSPSLAVTTPQVPCAAQCEQPSGTLWKGSLLLTFAPFEITNAVVPFP